MSRVGNARPRPVTTIGLLIVMLGSVTMVMSTAGPPASAFAGNVHARMTIEALYTEDSVQTWSQTQFKGASQAPDVDEGMEAKAHCDNADYLASEDNDGKTYPVSRNKADFALATCVRYATVRYKYALDFADELVDASGNPKNITTGRNCRFDLNKGRPKCNVIEQLGRGWHAIEDFYAHSNYADYADPNRKVDRTNPPGLGLDAPAVKLWDVSWYVANMHNLNDMDKWTQQVASRRPSEKLATGCYPNYVNGTKQNCSGRTKHDHDLNKDTENTRRSRVVNLAFRNFDLAYRAGVTEIRRQWGDFKRDLSNKYGEIRAAGMVRALKLDKP